MAVKKYELEHELDNSGLEEILETLRNYLKDEGIDCSLIKWCARHPGIMDWDYNIHAIKITGNSEYDFDDENVIYISYTNEDGEFLYNNRCGQLLGYFTENDKDDPFDGVIDTECDVPNYEEGEKDFAYINYETAVEEIKKLVDKTANKEKMNEIKEELEDEANSLFDLIDENDEEFKHSMAVHIAKKLIVKYDIEKEELFG